MADKILPVSGIYAITNLKNGLVYVGSAVNIRKRWNNHQHDLRNNRHHSPKLQHAWNKHGESAFSFVILEAVDSREKLTTVEQFWIDAFGACGKLGYNALPKAGSPLGYKATPETRAKLSAAHMGKVQTREFVEKRVAPLRGRKHSEERRANQSAAITKLKSALGYVDPNTGRKQTAEHIANVQKARGKVLHSEESRKKISDAKKGKPIVFKDPEARARKISETHKARFAAKRAAAVRASAP